MRSGELHVVLHDFAEQASVALAAAAAGGAEIGYEVVREGGRGGRPALYCYQALIGDYVARHGDALSRLPAYLPALHALAALDGLPAYLEAQAVPPPDDGGQRELADAVLRRFCERVFDGAGQDFALTAERFEPAFRELDRAAVEGRTHTVVVALLRGITTESNEVPLGEGCVLAPPECLEELPPDPVWLRRDEPSLVVAIAPGDSAPGIGAAVQRLCDLQTALRLFAPGIGFEPLAWVRGQDAPWRPLPLPARGHGGGAVTVLPEQEDELRAFCNLVAKRRPVGGELAWALERFELGCERDDPLAGLTDHLLALRALLEPEGPRSGRLAGRLAALCAVEAERQSLAERIAHGISLEQTVVAGAETAPPADALANEVEQHLRALLRDVICGHLPMPLDALADELLVGERQPPAVVSDAEIQVVGEDFEDLEAWGEGAPSQAELFAGR
jgi:hypothetical protein